MAWRGRSPVNVTGWSLGFDSLVGHRQTTDGGDDDEATASARLQRQDEADVERAGAGDVSDLDRYHAHWRAKCDAAIGAAPFRGPAVRLTLDEATAGLAAARAAGWHKREVERATEALVAVATRDMAALRRLGRRASLGSVRLTRAGNSPISCLLTDLTIEALCRQALGAIERAAGEVARALREPSP